MADWQLFVTARENIAYTRRERERERERERRGGGEGGSLFIYEGGTTFSGKLMFVPMYWAQRFGSNSVTRIATITANCMAEYVSIDWNVFALIMIHVAFEY